MLKQIHFEGEYYPEFQASGNAARFIMPFAHEVCTGVGYDIGCNREEWALPGARMIDLLLTPEWNANQLPPGLVDYIFSSHCLEHVEDWVGTLDYWCAHLKHSGVLFLYLPHPDQKYWRPWNNRKHRHVLSPQLLREYFAARGKWKAYVSERDLNHSFAVIASANVQTKEATRRPV